MKPSCDACGASYSPNRSWQRFCTPRCRTRYARGARAPEALADHRESGPGDVERATVDELAAAGRLGTVAGQVAVVLARRLDEPDRDTGAGVAAVSKQFAAAWAAALRDADGNRADPVDELRARRDRKRQTAAGR